jgi:hypothetical protein
MSLVNAPDAQPGSVQPQINLRSRCRCHSLSCADAGQQIDYPCDEVGVCPFRDDLLGDSGAVAAKIKALLRRVERPVHRLIRWRYWIASLRSQ